MAHFRAAAEQGSRIILDLHGMHNTLTPEGSRLHVALGLGRAPHADVSRRAADLLVKEFADVGLNARLDGHPYSAQGRCTNVSRASEIPLAGIQLEIARRVRDPHAEEISDLARALTASITALG
ncbi:MAG: hypothetical protein AB7Q01_07160 [Gammaproteobacteria bacterium]